MRHLMVSHGKGIACTRVKQLALKLSSHGKQAMFAQFAVQVNCSRYRDDAILRDKEDTRISRFIIVNQIATHCVQLTQIVRNALAIGAEPLEAIVQMWQID